MTGYNVVLLPGDGNGPGLVEGAATVLSAIGHKYNIRFNMLEKPIGGKALDVTGVPLPDDTVKACQAADGVIIGAIGGDKWNDLKPHNRPERALRALYSALGIGACIYPISPIHRALSRSAANADILLVRDMCGGTEHGEHGYRDGVLGQEGFDTVVCSISEAESIAKIAAALATERGSTLTSVDKADVLDSAKLWRATVERIAKASEVPHKIETAEAFILNVTKAPETYGVVLASNMLGAMLVTMLSAIPGAVGLMPMCALGSGKANIYGGVPPYDHDNPVGIILSSAMLLSSLKLSREAAEVELAVKRVLGKGLRTEDVANGKKYITGKKMAEEIAYSILNS